MTEHNLMCVKEPDVEKKFNTEPRDFDCQLFIAPRPCVFIHSSVSVYISDLVILKHSIYPNLIHKEPRLVAYTAMPGRASVYTF